METRCCFFLLGIACLLLPTTRCARKLELKEKWMKVTQDDLRDTIDRLQNYGVAKNVILFIGDGLGLPTTFAMRVHKGQKKGNPGEEELLNYEKFPSVALVKTYGTDRQIPESAGTATAIMSGVKTRWNLVGLDDRVTDKKCDTYTPESEVTTIMNWAEKEGRSTGLISTARVTHSTPAASYAKCPNRYWEDDTKLPPDAKGKCKDIAVQLIERGKNMNVILGGGRRHLLPTNVSDPADAKQKGKRTDGRDLTKEWQDGKKAAKYVWNKDQFDKVDVKTTDYLMGLFAYSHMSYEMHRIKNKPAKEPSIAEMTKKAVQILQKNKKGFFLLVEGARIDHAHHDGWAKLAIEDGLAFEEAIEEALKLTDSKDTLIVVTGDHSHSFTSGGYPPRGNPIFGITTALPGSKDLEPATDKMPYTTLHYGNGPGFNVSKTGQRANVTEVDTSAPDYQQQSAIPLAWETHSGEDVPVYALGPMAHLFQGLHEQTYIAHVMGYAACIGPNQNHCKKPITIRTPAGLTCLTDAEDRPKPTAPPCVSSAHAVRTSAVFFLICLVLKYM